MKARRWLSIPKIPPAHAPRPELGRIALVAQLRDVTDSQLLNSLSTKKRLFRKNSNLLLLSCNGGNQLSSS